MSNNRKATRGRKHVMRPDESKNKARALTQSRLLNGRGPATLSKIMHDHLPPSPKMK